MDKIRIKKGDVVKVITGKDKGKTGKVLKVFPKESRVLVDGINRVKKHMKPSKLHQGGVVEKSLPLHISNVLYFDQDTGKHSRVGYQITNDNIKKRFIKASQKIVE